MPLLQGPRRWRHRGTVVLTFGVRTRRAQWRCRPDRRQRGGRCAGFREAPLGVYAARRTPLCQFAGIGGPWHPQEAAALPGWHLLSVLVHPQPRAERVLQSGDGAHVWPARSVRDPRDSSPGRAGDVGDALVRQTPISRDVPQAPGHPCREVRLRRGSSDQRAVGPVGVLDEEFRGLGNTCPPRWHTPTISPRPQPPSGGPRTAPELQQCGAICPQWPPKRVTKRIIYKTVNSRLPDYSSWDICFAAGGRVPTRLHSRSTETQTRQNAHLASQGTRERSAHPPKDAT